MKKFCSFLHATSSIGCIILFILFAGNLLNNHSSFDSLKPLFIGFAICTIISKVTKHAADSFVQDSYRTHQNDYVRTHSDMMAQQNQHMIDEQNRQFMESSMRAMDDSMRATEEARLASTGIEFGGYNPDPNLNPSMHSMMDNFSNPNQFGMF